MNCGLSQLLRVRSDSERAQSRGKVLYCREIPLSHFYIGIIFLKKYKHPTTCTLFTHHFQELLLTLLIDSRISVTHHGNQHVEEQNRNENLKEHKNALGHVRIWRIIEFVIFIFTQGHVKKANPSCMVAFVQFRLFNAFHHKIKGLGEAKQENDVNYAESEHVTHYHGVNHGHKGPCELDSAENKERVSCCACELSAKSRKVVKSYIASGSQLLRVRGERARDS